MMKPLVITLIRHGLTFAGGALIAKGLTDAATMDQVTGAVTVIVSFIWSVVEKVTPQSPTA